MTRADTATVNVGRVLKPVCRSAISRTRRKTPHRSTPTPSDIAAPKTRKSTPPKRPTTQVIQQLESSSGRQNNSPRTCWCFSLLTHHSPTRREIGSFSAAARRRERALDARAARAGARARRRAQRAALARADDEILRCRSTTGTNNTRTKPTTNSQTKTKRTFKDARIRAALPADAPKHRSNARRPWAVPLVIYVATEARGLLG
jgi:hypothetical protein